MTPYALCAVCVLLVGCAGYDRTFHGDFINGEFQCRVGERTLYKGAGVYVTTYCDHVKRRIGERRATWHDYFF